MEINSLMLNALPITISQLNLILLAVGGLFLFFSIFWGMVRGFKKTSFRGLWLVFTILILFFLTPVISNLIVNADLSFIGAEFNGQPFTTINNAIVTFAESQGYSQILIDNPVIAEALVKIPLMIVNSIVFVLLFWVLKIALYPVWAIISAIIIKKKKSDGTKVKKQRLLGMAVGAVVGLLIGSITLMPIVNYTKLIADVEIATTSTEAAHEGGLITYALGEDSEVFDYIYFVQNSSINNVYKLTGLDALNSAIFSGLSSTHINKHSVRLKSETINIAKVVKIAMSLEDMPTDINEITQPELEKLLNTGQELIDYVFNINTLNALGDSLLPYFAKNIATNQDFIVTLPENENPHIDKLMRDSILTFENFNFSNLKQDLKSLVSAIQILNDADIILPIIHADTNNLESVQETTKLIDREALTAATNKLFGMKSVASISPVAINTAITLGYEQLDSGTITLNYDNISVSHLQHIFSELIATTLDIFNELDLTSDLYVSQPQTIVKVGAVLDLIKSYEGLPESEYNRLINIAIDLGKEQTGGISDIASAELIANLNNVIENIANVNSFETEMFAPLSLVLIDSLNIYDTVQTSNNLIEDINLATLGRVLDNVKTISIIAPEFEDIVKNSLDLVVNMFELPNEFSGFVNSIIEGAKENIKPSIVWEEELPLFKDFADYMMNINMSNALTEAGLIELGENLDILKQSALIGNKLNIVVGEVLDFATEEISEDLDALEDALNSIKTNLQNVDENVVWKTEMQAFGKLFNIADNLEDDYDAIGKMLDEIAALNSQLITRDLIDELVETMLTTAFEQLEHADKFEDVLPIITNNISEIDLFENEFSYLFTFIEELQEALDSDNPVLENIGKQLDDLDDSKLVGPARIEIVNMLFENVTDEVDITDQTVLDLLNETKDELIYNLENGASYETTLGELQTLINILEEVSPELENHNPNVLGPLLDELKDISIFGEVRTANIVIDIAEDLIAQVQDEIDSADPNNPQYNVIVAELNDIITDLQGMITDLENVETTPTPYYEEFLTGLYEAAEIDF